MALKTINGFDPAGGTNPVGSTGVNELAYGLPPSSANTNSNLRDLQQVASWGLAAGVLQGCVITATGLTAKLPAGSYYYAQTVWYGATDTTILIADASTSWLWGCSNGTLVATTTFVLPTGFSRAQACLLAKIVSVAGVCTIDLTVQDTARYADNTNRRIYEYNTLIGAGWVSEMDTVPADVTVTIPAGYQASLYGPVVNNGVIINNGRLRITD